MTDPSRQPVALEQGWGHMQLGINKLIRLLENEPEEQFNAEQYMSLYTCVRERCAAAAVHTANAWALPGGRDCLLDCVLSFSEKRVCRQRHHAQPVTDTEACFACQCQQCIPMDQLTA